MSCPTCDHTAHLITDGVFWCPRCGSLLVVDQRPAPAAPGTKESFETVYVPKLVDRCRQVEKTDLLADTADWHWWKKLGVYESINTPGNRRKT